MRDTADSAPGEPCCEACSVGLRTELMRHTYCQPQVFPVAPPNIPEQGRTEQGRTTYKIPSQAEVCTCSAGRSIRTAQAAGSANQHIHIVASARVLQAQGARTGWVSRSMSPLPKVSASRSLTQSRPIKVWNQHELHHPKR